jgi:hypothetical protein
LRCWLSIPLTALVFLGMWAWALRPKEPVVQEKLLTHIEPLGEILYTRAPVRPSSRRTTDCIGLRSSSRTMVAGTATTSTFV